MIEDDVYFLHTPIYIYIYHYYRLILFNICDEMFLNLLA